jgi:hypothetical protein
MKKTILYSHLFAYLSLFFFLAGCEREAVVSERIALNALKVELGVTRASDGDDPTLITPNNRPNWILEVQIEGNDTENYVFSTQDEAWIPQNDPAYFPADENDHGCNITFTLRPPTHPAEVIIKQDGSAIGLLEADTLKNTLVIKPQSNHIISLAHVSSLIEIAFDNPVENRVVEMTVQGNRIRFHSMDNKRYLGIVPTGTTNITFTTKVEGEENQYALTLDSETRPNARYILAFPFVHSPIIGQWSTTTEESAALNSISGVKALFNIEGYTGTISLMGKGNVFVRLLPHSGKKGEGRYFFPITVIKSQMIDSLLLEDYSATILIGRNTHDINQINLKVDSTGKVLPRKAQDGSTLINTVGEILSMNADVNANYRQEVDIDLSCVSNRNWEPIGNFKSPFKGTYDGGGHSIHSLNLNVEHLTTWNLDHLDAINTTYQDLKDHYQVLPAGAVGLFGVNQGTIKDVHIATGTISVSNIIREDTKSIAVGAVCGYNDGGYIAYCTNSAEVNVHAITKENRSFDIFTIGGICGTTRGNIEYCINYGSIIAESATFRKLSIGGISGVLYARYATDRVKINSCINHGDVFFNDLLYDGYDDQVAFHCGGISGMMHYYYNNTINIKETLLFVSNCYNTGDITDRTTIRTLGEFSGIVARMFFMYATYSCKISSCYNLGEIKVNSPAKPTNTIDPIICSIFEYASPPLPFVLPVESCYYDAKTWQVVRFHRGECYYVMWDGFTAVEARAYEKIAEKQLLESTPGFSNDAWPTQWDYNEWRNLGAWSYDGDPIYPKLKFEKD